MIVLPSGFTSNIKKIDIFDEDLEKAFPPQIVVDDLDERTRRWAKGRLFKKLK
ncbi:hypothetical protein N9272_00760 [bacterium]|nr:hypothetical protein [bacterium]